MNKKINNSPIDWADKLNEFNKRCRQQGLKITPQRIAIYKELSMSRKHPTATDIYTKIRSEYPNISLGTVNSSLLAFAERGVIIIIGASGDPKRFEGNLDPHDHFRCIECHKITDIPQNKHKKIDIPKKLKAKYLVMGKQVLFEGKCEKCR